MASSGKVKRMGRRRVRVAKIVKRRKKGEEGTRERVYANYYIVGG